MIGMKFDDIDEEGSNLRSLQQSEPSRPATFGVGVWKTRDGRMAEVTCDKHITLMFYELAGVIHFRNTTVAVTWTKNGVFMAHTLSDHDLDLVGPWVGETPTLETPALETPALEAPVAEAPKFGVGVWKTRNGSKVNIHRIDDQIHGENPFVLIGTIGASVICCFSWTTNGKFWSNSDNPYDLIEPWPQETQETQEEKPSTEILQSESEIRFRVRTITSKQQVAGRRVIRNLCKKLRNMDAQLRRAERQSGKSQQTIEAQRKAIQSWINTAIEKDNQIESLRSRSIQKIDSLERADKEQRKTIEAMAQTMQSWRNTAIEKDNQIDSLRDTLARERHSNIEESERMNKLIAQLSAATDERATEQKQYDPFLSAILRLKVLLVICRAVTVLLLVAIPLAGQWIAQNGPMWVINGSAPGTIGPGTFFAGFISWLGVCFIGATIAGEIQHGIRSNEAEYQRIRDKAAMERRQDW